MNQKSIKFGVPVLSCSCMGLGLYIRILLDFCAPDVGDITIMSS